MLSLLTKHKFHAAHFLPEPYEGKCSRMHGHTYLLEIQWKAIKDLDALGMLTDFHELKKLVEAYLQDYDHSVLNSTMNPNPTVEILVLQITSELTNILETTDAPIALQKVTLWETDDCAAVWEREKSDD